jgi:hypothetical protein
MKSTISSRSGFPLRAAATALVALLAAACGPAGEASANAIVVYKSPTCGCCSKWVQHLRDAGFVVDVRNEPAMNPLKARLGVPAELASCHTATVNGYVIEGHVPAQDIRRLLAEKPATRGLAVPGMPTGSPGMEQSGRVDQYEVLAFDGTNEPRVFSEHGLADAAHE